MPRAIAADHIATRLDVLLSRRVGRCHRTGGLVVGQHKLRVAANDSILKAWLLMASHLLCCHDKTPTRWIGVVSPMSDTGRTETLDPARRRSVVMAAVLTAGTILSPTIRTAATFFEPALGRALNNFSRSMRNVSARPGTPSNLQTRLVSSPLSISTSQPEKRTSPLKCMSTSLAAAIATISASSIESSRGQRGERRSRCHRSKRSV